MATIQVPDAGASVGGGEGFKVFKKELDLIPKSLYAPIYKWRRLTQVSGGSGLTLSTGSTNSIFNIPGGGVYNFSPSFLMFDLNLTAPDANILNTIWCDQIPIDNITLQTQTGQIVAQLTNVAPYTKSARFLCTPLKDYLSRESLYMGADVAGCFQTQNSFMQPARRYLGLTAPGTLVSAQVVANLITTAYVQQDGTISAIPTVAASGPDADYLVRQTIASGTAATASIVRHRVDLSAFVGTVLAANRNLYFGGQNMQLVINWSGLAKWGFISQVDATTGLANITAATTFTNYYLFLCEEVCEENIRAAKMAVEKPGGLAMYVPYTICPKLAVGAAGLTTMNTPLVAGFGILKRVLTCVVTNADTQMTSSNLDNVAGVKYTTVQSMLNNRPLQDWQLSCTSSDDYNLMYNMLKGTAAGISSRCFRINSFWCDNFSDADSGAEFPENDLMDSGHEVVNSENYSIQFTIVPATAQIYQYCTFVRRLVITNSVIQWA